MPNAGTANVLCALRQIAHCLKRRLGLLKDLQRLIDTGLPLSLSDKSRKMLCTNPPGTGSTSHFRVSL
jgi:hypothetical protein